MGKQTLCIEQMRHLKELGLNIDNASLCVRVADPTEYMFNYAAYSDLMEYGFETFPVFTVQDILDLLPIYIDAQMSRYELRIKRMGFDNDKVMYGVLYEAQDYIDWYVMQSYPELIDAAYEMLLWCIKEQYITVNQ